MTMQSDPIRPNKDKKRPLHFKEVDFSTMRKIDNSSILEMMKYDVHLLDTPRICPTNLKRRFNQIITGYITAERQRIEQEMEDGLIHLSNLLLGSRGTEDIRDLGLMNLHLRVQRFLRNPVYRSHAVHLLGVCLFSNLLIETDIDLLTLGRTEKYFYPTLESFNVDKGGPRQDERKPTYYPRGVRSRMRRGVYPAGELFAVKLRSYLKDKRRHKLSDAVCYFFDPFIWLNLYHDWGYIYEMEHSYSKEIYKEGHVPEGIKPIIEELNNRKDEIKFKLDDYLCNKGKLKTALEYILSLPLCFDSSKGLKVKKLRGLAEKELRKNKEPNHGVVSSLILYDKFRKVFRNLKVAKSIPERLASCMDVFLKDELGAICLHDLGLYKDENVKLGLTDSPHYFLLKFADVISDWGRTYKGKKSLYDFPILEYIFFGFNPVECTKPDGEKYEDKRGILVNVMFDFSNNERLLAGEIGVKGKNKNNYPGRDTDEFKEFVRKSEEFRSLDYSIETDGKKNQWFFFNLVLIDRYGERYLIENSKNSVDLWWIVPPLFSVVNCKKLRNKEFSRLVDYGNMKFEHEPGPHEER